MAPFHFLFLLLISASGCDAALFTFSNRCQTTIWPGILGNSVLMEGGFQLNPGQSVTVNVPYGWSGRVWGRTGCSFDGSGYGRCLTGDCGGVMRCRGAGGEPPASLAEFTLNSPLDYYDLSLVDGFNLPMSITPSGGCRAPQCVRNLNWNCPNDLRKISNGQVVGCKSACLAFGKPEFCCSGPYSSPETCKPSYYSKFFKDSCPDAYSYAYDDKSSTCTCNNGANYLISFC